METAINIGYDYQLDFVSVDGFQYINVFFFFSLYGYIYKLFSPYAFSFQICLQFAQTRNETNSNQLGNPRSESIREGGG